MDINKIRLEKKGAEAFLSPLESKVLETLWKKESAKVRDLHLLLKKDNKVALTSVAVILDRLHKKNLVKRKALPGKGGYHYIYTATLSKKDFEYSMMDKFVEKMIDTFGSSAVAYFNDKFSKGGRK